MKRFLVALMACAALLAGCTGASKKANQTDKETTAHDHSTHAGHDHSSHDHSSHDHSGHDHSAGDHASHDHSSHKGCSHDHGAPATVHEDFADEIIFPAEQAARTDFEVQTIKQAAFSEVIKAAGQIMAAQGDEVILAAPVAGIVSLAGPRLSQGAQVGGGQTLFYISSKNLASGDALAKVTAIYEKTKADYQRAESLRPGNLISEKDYQAVKLDYEQARSEYEALAGSRSDRGSGVASRIGGYVTSLDVEQGQFVEMGQKLATVSANRRLTLQADVSPRYMEILVAVRSANFTVPYNDRFYSLAEMRGRLISVGRSSAEGSYLVPVTFEFDNPGGILPGTFVEAYLIGAPLEGVVAVPLTAVTEQQGVTYVYIQLDEEGYAKREVALGGNDGQSVRVLSGLRAGERVVTRGAVHVKMAAASGSIPHGHAH